MEKNNRWGIELLIIVVSLAPIVYLMTIWNELPDQVPRHWNIHGEADGFWPKYWPIIMTGILYFLFLLLPLIDPRKKNYILFSASYHKLRLAIMAFFGVIQVMTMIKAMSGDFELGRIMAVTIMLFFAVLGNYMTTVRPNWFVGFRTPWTLESDEVWRKTHRMGGKLWFWAGSTLLVLSLFLPIAWVNPVMITTVLIIAAIPVIYSYILFKAEQKNDHNANT